MTDGGWLTTDGGGSWLMTNGKGPGSRTGRSRPSGTHARHIVYAAPPVSGRSVEIHIQEFLPPQGCGSLIRQQSFAVGHPASPGLHPDRARHAVGPRSMEVPPFPLASTVRGGRGRLLGFGSPPGAAGWRDQPDSLVISVIKGRNRAMTMKPMMPPKTTIMIGSSKLTRLSTRASTSSS